MKKLTKTKAFKSFKYELLYQSVLLMIKVSCTLPRKWMLGFYGWVGKMIFYLMPEERNKTIRNLRIAYGEEKSEKELRKMAKNVWINVGKSALELVRYRKINSLEDYDYVTVRGMEHMEAALAKGKGAVMTTSHLGPFEMTLYVVAMMGNKVATTGSPLKHEKLNKLMVDNRSRHGVTFVDRERSSLRFFRHLRGGNIVGLLIDQDSSKLQNTFIDFFGKKCATPKGAAVLALKSGAPVLPCHSYRDEHDNIIIETLPELEFELTGDEEKDINHVTQKIHDVTEYYVRKYPEQWVWMHERWKTPYPGVAVESK